MLFTEAAGHRAQRRSNIEVSSTLVVPVVDGRAVTAVLLCERRARNAFDGDHLDAAMTASVALAGLIGTESAERRRRHSFRTDPLKA